MKLLTTKQAAEQLGLAVTTLHQWRSQNKGPKFTKLGAAVRYSENDLNEYISQGQRTCTSRQNARTY